MVFTEDTLNDKVEKLSTLEIQVRENFENIREVLRCLREIQLEEQVKIIPATEDEESYEQTVRDITPIDRATSNPISSARRTEIFDSCISKVNELIGETEEDL